MRAFNNLKVRAELAIGFGAILMLLLAVGCFALLRLQATSDRHAVAGFLAAVLVAETVGLGFALRTSRAVIRPLQGLVRSFQLISGGRLDTPLDTRRTDEIGHLVRELNDMQARLKEQLARDQEAAVTGSRIRCGLDRSSAAMLITNESNVIVYVNAAMSTLLRVRLMEIRSQSPAFDLGAILGTNVDQLGLHPERDGAAHGAQVFNLKWSNCTLRVSAEPIVDGQGARVGTVTEWTDLTQTLQVEEEVNAVVRSALDGDFSRRVRVTGTSGFFESLSSGLNRLLDNTTDTICRIRVAAAEVQRGADEISAGNTNLSQRTEQQASSLEETASSMEEMTSTVKQNADNAAQANQLASAARAQAESGGSVVGTAVRAMSEINSSSARIADIIGVIDEIAFQTNLLALNAAVEAARAGEQGRGFAVVATEVRSLAGRSATAAREIKELIEDSVRKVEHGSALVTQSGQTLEQIVVAVKKVSDIVAEIAAASREQASGIEQVDRAITQMDGMTQQNAALVEQAAAASQSMADQARELAKTMQHYRLGTSSDDSASPAAAAGFAAPRAPAQTALPVADRRRAARPWRSPRAQAKEAPDSRPVTPVASVATAGAAEWQEF
jgi:methyl-accepting chemotaxis protein